MFAETTSSFVGRDVDVVLRRHFTTVFGVPFQPVKGTQEEELTEG